jgi:dolichol-phosphate mannosyltransferase
MIVAVMKTGVVIPCYKVSRQILGLLQSIGPEVSAIYVVDDSCPEGSGKLVEANCRDPRVKVIYHEVNQGVGGAVITGYSQALRDGCEVVVKLDGDGQMNPAYISRFLEPIRGGMADYTKGNRFFALDTLSGMPFMRVIGNAALSFVSKAASGYWNVMDPTNGYTAIHSAALALLPLEKLDRRYFFESDMLFRLNTVRAVVLEIPMEAQYGGETSSLRIGRVLLEFPFKFGLRSLKRIFYNYFLRDFNICSLEIIFGTLLLLFGGIFGSYHWYLSSTLNMPASTGTVMVAALPVILGFQLLLSALSFDSMNIPKQPLHKLMQNRHGVAGNKSA